MLDFKDNQDEKVITAGAFVNLSDMHTAIGRFKALAYNDEPSDLTVQDIFKLALSDTDEIIQFNKTVQLRKD